MVIKIRLRMVKRVYKGFHSYPRCWMEFPKKIYKKLEPHIAKNFDDIDVTYEENSNQEIVKIILIKKKAPT